MERTTEQWQNCCPAAMAGMSRAAIEFAFADAKKDQLFLRNEVQRLQSEVSEWQKLRDPVTLHVSLLRGFPARLDRETFLHLAGDETPNESYTP
jgi:hypothetical protein